MNFEVCYHLVGKDELSYQIHTHNPNSVEILHVVSGNGTVLLGDKLYPLQKGMLCIIPSSELHCTNPEKEADYIRSRVTTESEKLRDLLDVMELEHLSGGGIFLPQNTEVEGETNRIFSGLSKATSTHHVIALLCELLRLVSDSYQKQAKTESSTASQVVEWINEHITEPITLETAAANFHLNKSYLCRLFKQKTDFTINGYILQQRLGIAKHALRYGSGSVAQIAQDSGFGSQAYFCRMFKQHTGITPKQYRMSHRAK